MNAAMRIWIWRGSREWLEVYTAAIASTPNSGDCVYSVARAAAIADASVVEFEKRAELDWESVELTYVSRCPDRGVVE